jgi:outer membrane lipoprotein-sorting protein
MHRRSLILRLLCLLALALVPAACARGGARLPADPTEAVRQAARNQMANLPMRVTMEMAGAGSPSRTVVEYASPQRVRMRMDGLEVLLVDGQAWRKEGTAWVEDAMLTAAAAAVAEGLDADALEEMLATITDARRVGEETIDGEPTVLYTYGAERETMGVRAATTTRLWVRTADGLPVRQEVEAEAMGRRNRTLMTIEYDDTIRVEAPE